MARVIPAPHILNIRNKLGTGIYQNYKGTIVLRSMPVTVANPKTVPQEMVRRIVAELPSRWRGLTEEQKRGWEEKAQEFGGASVSNARIQSPMIIRPLTGPMHGFNLFVRLNVLLKLYKAKYIDTPPVYLTKRAPELREVEYLFDATRERWFIRTTFYVDAGDTILLWVRPPDPYFACVVYYGYYARAGEYVYDLYEHKGVPIQYIGGRWCFQMMCIGAVDQLSAPSQTLCVFVKEVGMVGVGDVIYTSDMHFSTESTEYVRVEDWGCRKDPNMAELTFAGFLRNVEVVSAYVFFRVLDAPEGTELLKTAEVSVWGDKWTSFSLPLDVSKLTNGTLYVIELRMRTEAGVKPTAVMDCLVIWVSKS